MKSRNGWNEKGDAYWDGIPDGVMVSRAHAQCDCAACEDGRVAKYHNTVVKYKEQVYCLQCFPLVVSCEIAAKKLQELNVGRDE